MPGKKALVPAISVFDNYLERCHRSVSGVVGKLISSTEPHTTCTYDIVRPGYKITLRFLSLRLPKSGDCDANYIEVISKRVRDHITNFRLIV